MKKVLGTVASLARETYQEYQADEVPRMGASLAYYTVFSMAPVLVIAVGLAGFLFGHEAATGQLQSQLQVMMGDAGSAVISEAITNASSFKGGTLATIIGVVTLIVGASGAFVELQNALNRVWDSEEAGKRAAWSVFLRRRMLSFGMVLVLGFLLAVSTLLTVAVTGLGEWAGGRWQIPPLALEAANFGISFVVITVLFGFMYKALPDAKVAWNDVWIGAVGTALLFAIGKSLIGLYIGHSSIASTFGAAGSLVVVLVWVYYSSQILLFGAEFTQVYSRLHGSRAGQARKTAWNEDRTAGQRSRLGIPADGVAAVARTGEKSKPVAAGELPARKRRFRKIAGVAALAAVVASRKSGFGRSPRRD